LAQWVSREKPGHSKDATDYFLAGKSLPWWAIGASLIAANISAEQIIGMSGSGYAIGLAIASYEWMAAITLILVGKYLLPVFLKTGIYTMPQFLEQRYDHRVKTVMASFWLGVYVFVNLTSILWLGALAINTVAGIDLTLGLVLLGFFCHVLLLIWRPQGGCIDRHCSSGIACRRGLDDCRHFAGKDFRWGGCGSGFGHADGDGSRSFRHDLG
jgi:uncharacterized sodium:solute symporter family permease YidK